MEFFEKAHVAKSNNSSRKEHKSEENVKKQLKQMLYGYQHSDNALIRDSVNVANELDDSSSVSGFSDLNLTISSSAADTSQETIDTDYKDVDASKVSNLSLEESVNESFLYDDVSNNQSCKESISEYSEDVESLSEDSFHGKTDNTSDSDKDTLDSSFIETSTDIDSDSEGDSEFDVDGVLAAKILEKLNTKESKKNRKRKLNEMEVKKKSKEPLGSTPKYNGPFRPEEDSSKNDDMKVGELSDGVNNIKLPKTKKFNGPYKPKDDESSEEDLAENFSLNDTSLDSDTTNQSSPFVSVIATDMQSESLADILGEYRHPTIRNLPSDKQNVVFADEYDLFQTDEKNVSVVDMQTEDEVGSLIPEVDNVPAVEEIDLDTTDFDASIQPNEDSTALYDTIQSEETSEKELTDLEERKPINPVKVYYGKNNSCVFILQHPAQMYIHGKVKVRALGGSIEVQGYTLKDKPCEVYAPNYNYAHYLRTVENQNAYYGLFGKLTSVGMSVSEAEDIVTTLGEYDGVVCMQPLRSKKMDFVENNFSVTDLFSKPNKNIEHCLKKASQILGCSLYLTRPWKCFEENISWKQAIKYGSNKNSRGIVCGGKGTGKSTFLRYYVNRLVSTGPVLLVDLDPGQCEVTLPGNVSATVLTEPLLGPNFTHLKTPQMMLNVGMINTMDNPRRYVAAVEALIAHCSNDPHLRDLPWIVNTMGMTNNLGLKFISLIILHTQPTFLLQIDSRNAKKRYDYHLYPQTVKNLYFEDFQNDRLFKSVRDVNIEYSFVLSHHADNTVKNNFSLAPRDERYLNFLAYFGELIDTNHEDLLSIVPYEVNLKDLNIGLNVKVSHDAVTKVINGKVVALCQHSGDRRLFTLADTPLRCFGAGLVRGVDEARGVVLVLTPQRAAADTLLYAAWAPELRTEAALPPGLPVPYRTAARYDQRQHMFAPKRRFNPVQLLKMSRRT